MTGPGRPKIGEPVLIRLPADQVTYLDNIATAYDISRAEVVRRIIAEHQRIKAKMANLKM